MKKEKKRSEIINMYYIITLWYNFFTFWTKKSVFYKIDFASIIPPCLILIYNNSKIVDSKEIKGSWSSIDIVQLEKYSVSESHIRFSPVVLYLL